MSKLNSYKKRVNKLIKAYMKDTGFDEKQTRELVEAELEEESIEVLEQNVDEGLLSVDDESLKSL